MQQLNDATREYASPQIAYYNPAKKLLRTMSRCMKKYVATPEKAVLKRARIIKKAEATQRKLERLLG